MFLVIEDTVQRNELEEFYKENINCFLNIAYLKLHNKNDAEDAVQEAFCEIARQPDKFFSVAPKNRVGYMVVVIRNIASDMFNKKNKIPLEATHKILCKSIIQSNKYGLLASIIGDFLLIAYFPSSRTDMRAEGVNVRST